MEIIIGIIIVLAVAIGGILIYRNNREKAEAEAKAVVDKVKAVANEIKK